MTRTDDYQTQSIQLIGVGRVRAKPAYMFKVGENMMWNYGSRSKVLAIIDQTPKQIVFAVSGDLSKSESASQSYTRRMKKDRLVGIGQ